MSKYLENKKLNVLDIGYTLNQAKKPEKSREKVAETAEIPKTAPQTKPKKSSPNLCVNSSSSYISPSMLPLSSGDLIEWSLVCHSILSYQKFCD